MPCSAVAPSTPSSAASASRAISTVARTAAGSAALPPTDALRFRLAGDARVVVRPSGTEPKLKCYLEVIVPVTASVAVAREAAGARLAAMKHDLTKETDLSV